MYKKQEGRDVITVGFALFAMFFGAGNLIFPPYLGLVSGSNWLVGFICYIIVDAGLAMVTVVTMVKCGGQLSGVTGRIGRRCSILVGVAVALCIGPMLAIPRTAATAFEVGIEPIGLDNRVLFSAIYFMAAFFLTVRSTAVVDIVGKFLTPLLLVGLTVMIIVGVVAPIGPIVEKAGMDIVARDGITSGYQTLDAFAALLFSMIIIQSVEAKGYLGERQSGFVLKTCILAGAALFFVYGGLTYLGATVSDLIGADISHSALLIYITKEILGYPGVILLGVVVVLACLTTVIGLTASISTYFSELSGGRISYKTLVTVIMAIGFILSCLGLNTIVSLSAPVLNTLYPMVLVLILLSLFKKQVKNDNIVKGAAFTALAVSILNTADGFGLSIPLLHVLPLYQFGLNWILPAVVGGLLGNLIKMRPQAEEKREQKSEPCREGGVLEKAE